MIRWNARDLATVDQSVGQTRRSKVTAVKRHRLQCARLIAEHVLGHRPHTGDRKTQLRYEVAVTVLLDGVATFDVHSARDVGYHHANRRVGQRLIDSLDGQPDKCGHWTAVDGQTMRTVIVGHVPTPMPCGCNGTGHNLRGTLPPIEWSPAVRRKISDGRHTGAHLADWQLGVIDDLRYESIAAGHMPDQWDDFGSRVTRVGNRGENWRKGPYGWAPASTATMWNSVDKYGRAWDLMPGWRRGELLHKRRRNMRRPGVTAKRVNPRGPQPI